MSQNMHALSLAAHYIESHIGLELLNLILCILTNASDPQSRNLIDIPHIIPYQITVQIREWLF